MAIEENFYRILPPTDATEGPATKVLSVATSGAAGNYDWVSTLGANAPKGACLVCVEASTYDCFVRFKAGQPWASPSAAATTVTNGLRVVAGQPGRTWYVNPLLHGCLDIIAAGVGTLQIQVSSPMIQRTII